MATSVGNTRYQSQTYHFVTLKVIVINIFRCCLQGNVSSYLAKRYDFSPECKVVAFTGDNLDSLAGLGVQPNDLIVSNMFLFYKIVMFLSPPLAVIRFSQPKDIHCFVLQNAMLIIYMDS